MVAEEELIRLRQELEAMRTRMDEVSGAVDQLASGDFAPDGSGDRPVVLPRLADVPIMQDTHLLHMAVKPFLRKRLGDRTNAAQVLLDVVERDATGRERSWAFLPGPFSDTWVEVGNARLFEALGDATNRNVLAALWEGEKAAPELAARIGVDADGLATRLTVLSELAWVIELPNGRLFLSEHGRRAAICVSTLASALRRPR